jgi:hypothetical protein
MAAFLLPIFDRKLMNFRTMNLLGIFVIGAALASATVFLVSLPNPAAADKGGECRDDNGFERADCEVHENTGPVSDQDINFHEGTCQGGHTSEALEGLGGCEILTPPGNSDDNRNDD